MSNQQDVIDIFNQIIDEICLLNAGSDDNDIIDAEALLKDAIQLLQNTTKTLTSKQRATAFSSGAGGAGGGSARSFLLTGTSSAQQNRFTTGLGKGPSTPLQDKEYSWSSSPVPFGTPLQVEPGEIEEICNKIIDSVRRQAGKRYVQLLNFSSLPCKKIYKLYTEKGSSDIEITAKGIGNTILFPETVRQILTEMGIYHDANEIRSRMKEIRGTLKSNARSPEDYRPSVVMDKIITELRGIPPSRGSFSSGGGESGGGESGGGKMDEGDFGGKPRKKTRRNSKKGKKSTRKQHKVKSNKKQHTRGKRAKKSNKKTTKH